MVFPDEHYGDISYVSKSNNNVEKLKCSFTVREFWVGSLSRTQAFDRSKFHDKHGILIFKKQSWLIIIFTV